MSKHAISNEKESVGKFSRNLCMSLESITDCVNGFCHAILEKHYYGGAAVRGDCIWM